MEKIFQFILKHNRAVIIVFVVLSVFCLILSSFVERNYNLVDYLPRDAESTTAFNIMNEEFDKPIQNLRACIEVESVQEAIEIKNKISSLETVIDIMWLDDVVNLSQPIENIDKAISENYYKDNTALYTITIKKGTEIESTNNIRGILGPEGALSGESVNLSRAQKLTATEVLNIVIMLVPIIAIILLFTTNSWTEPLFIFAAIGVSICINMGTNVFFKNISFVTASVSPILQLAVSLDYAIFLLGSFRDFRKTESDVKKAMLSAMKRSLPAISASAITTLLGFLALVFMRFGLGSDLGINLAKGIFFSLLSSMILLPALVVTFYRIIEKTTHKPFIKVSGKFGGFIKKLRIPVLIAVIIVAVPCFLAQHSNDFLYGMEGAESNTSEGLELAKINNLFGESTPIVLLVPKGEPGKEAQMCSELKDINHITSIISYSTSVGNVIPSEFLDESVLSNFYSENYSRIVLNANTTSEGDEAFNTVENVRKIAKSYYGNDAYTCGASVNIYDMKTVITSDSLTVNLLAIAAIAITLLITFKSISLPFILLITIEASIWINLALPYFMGTKLSYIGFLIVSSVQLGATVDYAILFTDHYISNRKNNNPLQALNNTVSDTTVSILTSAIILTIAGIIIGIISTQNIVSQLGTLLGRGAFISAVLVFFVLPAALTIFDKVIAYTTIGAGYMRKTKNKF